MQAMKQRTGFLSLAAVGAAAVIGLTACGAGAERTPSEPSQPLTDLSAEEQALGVVAEPQAYQSHGADKPGRHWGKRKGHRGFLAQRVLHGELVVDTKQGPRTIVVQRGTVTKVDDDSVTVKSSDGFTLTWTYGEKLRVIERRTTVDGDDLDVGETVGIAGRESQGDPIARLIVITHPR